jgi:hypothetical protein
MVVPPTADGFRDKVSALWSLDGSSGVSFHTISLPDAPRALHFIVPVARGPEVSRLRSFIELCGLRVTVES